MSFLLEAIEPFSNKKTDGYYTGKTYIFQGAQYAVVDPDIDNAKRYKFEKVAQNACNSYLETIENYVFKVVEVTDSAEPQG